MAGGDTLFGKVKKASLVPSFFIDMNFSAVQRGRIPTAVNYFPFANPEVFAAGHYGTGFISHLVRAEPYPMARYGLGWLFLVTLPSPTQRCSQQGIVQGSSMLDYSCVLRYRVNSHLDLDMCVSLGLEPHPF